MEFDTWYDEADIPMKDSDGSWYDAETGISYADWCKTPRLDYRDSKHADGIKAARQEARELGWPELTGTTKQKWWAVQVRRDLIFSLPAELRSIAAKMSTSARWWIDQRVSGEDFLPQVKEFDEEMRRRAEAVRKFQLFKVAEHQAKEDAKLEEFRKSASEQMIVFRTHASNLAPFSGQPRGEKKGDFMDEDVRVRVFHNHTTNMVTYLADTPTGKMTFTIDV